MELINSVAILGNKFSEIIGEGYAIRIHQP